MQEIQGIQGDHKISIKVPFINARQAEIASNSLEPDLILKTQELEASCSSKGSDLILNFSGSSNRVLRVAINTILENLKTVIECIDEFEDTKDKYIS